MITCKAWRETSIPSPISLERKTHTRIPLPRGIDLSAFRSFHIEVEMHILTEIQIRTDTEFPPAATEILIIGIRSHAIAHAHSHITLEIVEVGRADIDIARFDILAQRESEAADKAVQTVLMNLRPFRGGEICRRDLAIGQLSLRFDPEAILLETLAIFRRQRIPIRAVLADTDATDGIEIILHVSILGDEIDEAAIIAQVAAIHSKTRILICTAAADQIVFTIGIGEGAAQDPVIRDLVVIAQLIVIVLVLHALRAVLRFAAAHARPDALLALAVTDLAKTLVHIIVFLTPGHERKCTELADGKVRLVLGFHFIDDMAVCVHLCVILPCDHSGIRLEALCDRFAIFIDSYTSQLLRKRAVAGDQIRNIAGSFDGDICIRRILCLELIIEAVAIIPLPENFFVTLTVC